MTDQKLTYSAIDGQCERGGFSKAHYYRGMKKGILPEGELIGGRRIIPDHLFDAAMRGEYKDGKVIAKQFVEEALTEGHADE